MFPLKFPLQDGRELVLSLEERAEAEVVRLIAAHTRPGQVFVDVGAYIGDYAEWTALRGCEVHAFEPLPDSYKALAARRGGIRAYHTAVGDEKGSIPFYIREHPAGCTGVLEGPDDFPRIDVPCARLDDFALKPDWLKIDVEKYELKVLRGAAQTIAEHRPYILLEYHSCPLRRQAKALLESWRYRFRPLFEMPSHGNHGQVLAEPEERAPLPVLDARLLFPASSCAGLAAIKMRDVAARHPGAKRALFAAYHVGEHGPCFCSDICHRPIRDDQTLAENLLAYGLTSPEEASQVIAAFQRQEDLLGVRAWDGARLVETSFFKRSQQAAEEVMERWPRDGRVLLRGEDALELAAHLYGQGFKNVRALRDAPACADPANSA